MRAKYKFISEIKKNLFRHNFCSFISCQGELSMVKKYAWLVLALLAVSVVSTASIAAESPKTEVTLVSISKLSDAELDQIQGQGEYIAHRGGQPSETVAAIKLWDEWLRPQTPSASNNDGRNQQVLSGSFGPRN
jgi:hypothetical protein